jgi:hypothetical protein
MHANFKMLEECEVIRTRTGETLKVASSLMKDNK